MTDRNKQNNRNNDRRIRRMKEQDRELAKCEREGGNARLLAAQHRVEEIYDRSLYNARRSMAERQSENKSKREVVPLSPEAQARAEVLRAERLRQAALEQPTRTDLVLAGIILESVQPGSKAAEIARVAVGLDYLPEGEKCLTAVDEYDYEGLLEELALYDRRILLDDVEPF